MINLNSVANRWPALFLRAIIFVVMFSALVFLQSTKALSQKPGPLGSVVLNVLDGLIFDEVSPPNVDLDEGYLLSFKIYLRSPHFFKEMEYRKGGQFYLDVRPGLYEVVLKTREGKPVNYRRANFQVFPNKTVI